MKYKIFKAMLFPRYQIRAITLVLLLGLHGQAIAALDYLSMADNAKHHMNFKESPMQTMFTVHRVSLRLGADTDEK